MPPSDSESSQGLVVMTFIRLLTNSSNESERDTIKNKLENLLQESDHRLTKQVSEQHKELRLVVQAFTSISMNLQKSLDKISRAKQRLKDCREMLTSRLDELRRLSDESKRNEKIISILDQIDELTRVPAQILDLLTNFRYLEATRLLIEKQRFIEDNFESFDCLEEVKSELDSKREELYRTLREKLFIVDDELVKSEIIESLKMIDKNPELLDLGVVKDEMELTETAKPFLFKFSMSSHAICFNEHYKEQMEATKTLLSK